MLQKPLSLRFVVTATLLGNAFEWYEAATFGFVAPILMSLFFPITDIWTFPLLTLMAFAGGHILRPVSGLFFGYISDRYGRKVTLLISIACASLTSFIIGFLPTYWHIGISATILFIVMRFLQGLAAGAEFPTAVTFLVESSPKPKQGFIGSFAYFGVALGLSLGGLDFFVVQSHFTEEAFAKWGWRSMYLLGGVLGLVAFWLRSKLHETSIFLSMQKSHENTRHPIKLLFYKHKKALGKLIGIEILETLGYNLTISFFVIYLTVILKLSFQEATHLNLLFLITLVISIPFAGLLSSKIGPKKLAIYAAWAYFILSLPLYWLLGFDTFRILSSILLGAMVGFYMAPMPVLYCDLFPTKVRNSGIGFGLNLAIGLLGGFGPVLALGLIRSTGFKLAPGVILMIGALISLATLRSIKYESLETVS